MRNGDFLSVSRTVPGYAGVRGSATNNATVTVNGNTAWRLGEYFYGGDDVENSASAVMKELDITAVVNPAGTNEADLVESVTGKVYVAKSPEAFTYDDDGNMLSDGRFTYTWNGENRLICAEEQVCPTNRTLRKVDYAYDHQGRMVLKEIKHRGAEAQSWEEEKAISYLWDGYNIIAETASTGSSSSTTYNIWGLDLDGTMQGAGGVGGLLAVVKDSAMYIPSWDANGNVMEYVSADGSIVAHREYDPFGGTVVYTEQSAITNQQSSISFSHWFSTKPWCSMTGLSEYQYRKYSPRHGRWLSRDLAHEIGGVNLFVFVQNHAISVVDILGLMSFSEALAKVRSRESEVKAKLVAKFEGFVDLAYTTKKDETCPDCILYTCSLAAKYKDGSKDASISIYKWDPPDGTPAWQKELFQVVYDSIQVHEKGHVEIHDRYRKKLNLKVSSGDLSDCSLSVCFGAAGDVALSLAVMEIDGIMAESKGEDIAWNDRDFPRREEMLDAIIKEYEKKFGVW